MSDTMSRREHNYGSKAMIHRLTDTRRVRAYDGATSLSLQGRRPAGHVFNGRECSQRVKAFSTQSVSRFGIGQNDTERVIVIQIDLC